MKQINSALIVILAASLTLGSCKSKNVFDQEKYDEIITGQFPIEPIDQTQTWNLSGEYGEADGAYSKPCRQ